MFLVIIIAVVALLIVFANWQVATKTNNPLVTITLNGFVLLMGCCGVTIFFQIIAPNPMDEPLAAAPTRFFVVVWLAAFLGSFAIINLPEARQLLERLLDSKRKRVLKKPHPRYDARSVVHTTAIVLALFYLVYNAYTFMLVGGLQGVAESYGETAPNISDMVFDVFLYVGFAVLGVGLFMRRNVTQTLRRLGLRFPRLADVVAGTLAGIGMYIVVFIFLIVQAMFVPREVLQEQQVAAAAVSNYPTLGLALFMAIKAGIGEEILFRGALQPIFGVILTTALFSAVHQQYTLTPASVIIFFVGMALAQLRWRYSTTAAIIAHATYNFLPYLLFGV